MSNYLRWEPIKRAINILFSDLLPANFTCMLPNALKWAGLRLTNKIHVISVKQLAHTDSKVHLFAHTTCFSNKTILLLHGDHAHPFSTLHLGEIAEQEGYSVYSAQLDYKLLTPEIHRKQLHKCIKKIQKLNPMSQIVLAGHSRGAQEAAIEAYESKNLSVKKVIGIAGRHNQISGLLSAPFYQIRALHDWCIPKEASVVRNDHPNITVDASHLSVLAHRETLAFFRQALKD